MGAKFLYFVSLILISIVFETLYFKIAKSAGIIDRPNQRSSHQVPTIRGGGVIFFLAVLIWFLTNDFKWPWMMLSVSVVAIVSFLDDIKERPAFLRLVIHLIAILLVFFQIEIFDWPFALAAIALVICIGSLSAFNFMDGINGITGLYALVNLSSFYWIHMLTPFSDIMLIIAVMASVCVFLFFNFRNRAVCFAGDVGSVALALIQIFFLLQLIIGTDNFIWVIMFLVYGIDSVVTIIYRLKSGENLLKPHRSHLYQYMANELGWSHKRVALVYASIQGILNIVSISAFQGSQEHLAVMAALVFLIFYLVVRIRIYNGILSKGQDF